MNKKHLLTWTLLYVISVTPMEDNFSDLTSFLKKSYNAITYWSEMEKGIFAFPSDSAEKETYKNNYINSDTFNEAFSTTISSKKESFPSDIKIFNTLINPNEDMIFPIPTICGPEKFPSFKLALLLSHTEPAIEWVTSYYVPSNKFKLAEVENFFEDLCFWRTPDYTKMTTVLNIVILQNSHFDGVSLLASILTGKKRYGCKKIFPSFAVIRFLQERFQIIPSTEGYVDKIVSCVLLKALLTEKWRATHSAIEKLFPLLEYCIQTMKLDPNVIIDEAEQLTPLDWVVRASHEKAIRLLKQAGAHTNTGTVENRNEKIEKSRQNTEIHYVESDTLLKEDNTQENVHDNASYYYT